jgi:photosystem II stability/assembly factor-like uncharacterized protein
MMKTTSTGRTGTFRLIAVCILGFFLAAFTAGCKFGDGGNDANGGGDNTGNEPPQVSTSQWQELGPAPIGSNGNTGRVSAIGVSAQNANLYYVGGADGGVWKSEDAGATWRPLTDHLPTTAIGAIAVDPDNDQVVYAGSGEANFANHSRYGLGLYKTSDGGENWEVLAADAFSGRCFSRLLIDPADTDILYASITHAGGLPSFDFNIAAARGHNGAQLPLGVWKSEDGGRNWQQLTNGMPGDLSATDLAMDFTDPSVIYAAVAHVFGDSRNGIYKTTDRGVSWTKLGGGLPAAGVGGIALATTAADAGRIFASIVRASTLTGSEGSTYGIYRSDDSGNSWTLKYGESIHASYGWYLNVIAISPTDPNVVFAGGLFLHRSLDGGDNWANVTQSIHVDHHALAFDAQGRFLAGNDGGVFRTDNLGNSWQALNNGLGIVQFYAGISLDPDNSAVIYGGTQDNGTLKRTGSDKNNWLHILGGDGGWTGVKPNEPNIVFAESQGSGGLFKSVDGGSQFTISSSGISRRDPNCFLPPYHFDPSQPDHMYYATHRLYKSTNSGGNWSLHSSDLTNGNGAAIRGFAIAPSNPSVLYAGTNDGLVWVSFDGGVSWDLSLTGVPGWPRVMRQFAVDSIDHLTAYLAVSYFGTNQVLMTSDGGQNWQSLDNNLIDIPVNTVCLDPRNSQIIYIGTDAGVYRSGNGGGSWERYGQGLPNCTVNDIRIDVDNNLMYAATQGRGMWMIGIED